MSISTTLIEKYNIPAPRYTSYPTVPLWEHKLNTQIWEDLVRIAFRNFGSEEGISLYIHLPFCESLCTYCGCTKRITKNHAVEFNYIKAIHTEWNHYLALFDTKPKLAGIHLGGGTPTFFAPDALHKLLSWIISSSEVLDHAEFSFEGHPNNTAAEHLSKLASMGFDRVSYGIQDFDRKVQQAIHRIQPVGKVREATENARKYGYRSINFDLIYGLPHQTIATMGATFEEVAKLAPDRIAFYSYAHLPAMFPAQKSFESYLPDQDEKRALYEFGKTTLLSLGYEEIGMDHFAKPGDPLHQAKKEGKLHRNFMGYTTLPAKMLIGLGASSISDIHLGYAQNEKNTNRYQESLASGQWPITKGHVLTEEDLEVKDCILDLICKHETVLPDSLWSRLGDQNRRNLYEMEGDGLLTISGNKISVTHQGIALVRNICMQLDLRLVENQTHSTRFSNAI